VFIENLIYNALSILESLMRNWIKNSCYIILGLIGFNSTHAEAAVDMYLCIDGIQGETSSKSDPDCIDVLAWSWGMSNSGVAGGAAGKANFQDISLTKYQGTSSSALMLNTANGKSIGAFELRVRKTCSNPGCVGELSFKLTVPSGSKITSVSTGGSGGEDRLTENISINMPEAQWCFTDFDISGVPKSTSCEGYNFIINEPL
jgi:type VI secretion system secreted protein Hcp